MHDSSGISHEGLHSAVFAGGCFWCVEADFGKRPDIKDIESGYTGGESDDPSYENAHTHGHREAVRVWFDSSTTSYKDLVVFFFTIHDPTDAGGSFHDRGHQYTSAIYFGSDEERRIAEEVKDKIDKAGIFSDTIATEVLPLEKFWTAEDYHQEYADKNPGHYGLYRKASGRDDFISRYKKEIYELFDKK